MAPTDPGDPQARQHRPPGPDAPPVRPGRPPAPLPGPGALSAGHVAPPATSDYHRRQRHQRQRRAGRQRQRRRRADGGSPGGGGGGRRRSTPLRCLLGLQHRAECHRGYRLLAAGAQHPHPSWRLLPAREGPCRVAQTRRQRPSGRGRLGRRQLAQRRHVLAEAGGGRRRAGAERRPLCTADHTSSARVSPTYRRRRCWTACARERCRARRRLLAGTAGRRTERRPSSSMCWWRRRCRVTRHEARRGRRAAAAVRRSSSPNCVCSGDWWGAPAAGRAREQWPMSLCAPPTAWRRRGLFV